MELVEVRNLAPKPPADGLTQLEDGVVRDCVEDADAVPTPRHEAGGVEHAEVLGDVLLRRAERVGQFLDAGFVVAKAVEKADAHRLPHDAEPLGDLLDEWSRKWVDEGHAANALFIKQLNN